MYDPTGKDIEKSRIGVGDVHPAMPVFQQFDIRRGTRVLKQEQMGFYNPAILGGQVVNVLQCFFVDVYLHVLPLF